MELTKERLLKGLTEDQLEAVSGGFCADFVCSKCECHTMDYTESGGYYHVVCPHRRNEWTEKAG